jgi:hypothetical protein
LFVRAFAVAADGHMYKIAEPAIKGHLDSNVAVAGLAADGDSYLVEVECGTYLPGW